MAPEPLLSTVLYYAASAQKTQIPSGIYNTEDGLKKGCPGRAEGVQINARFLLPWVQAGFIGHLVAE